MRDKVLSVLQNFNSLEKQIGEVGGSDPARLASLSKERKKLEASARACQEWLRMSDELSSLDEMLAGGDPQMADLARQEKAELEPRFREFDLKLYKMLNPPDPRADRTTIVEIRSGAGGDEAGLFVAELFRMYSQFARSKGLTVTVYESTPTGVGGLKEVIFEIDGPNAFGWFRFETGVHRVQRVPKTEAQGRIHTSTVTVAVLPEATEVEIKVDPKDLRIDTYRASGAGGQHVNKTDSAIRITHIPTGIVVQCQEERSQGQNRLRAMGLLRAKLQEAEEERRFKERADLRKKQIGTGDRSEKIRTYNFPQDRVTDHRINVSVHHIEKFMEGDIQDMIDALLAKEEELFKENKI
jgi:peptide chain release factor 1